MRTQNHGNPTRLLGLLGMLLAATSLASAETQKISRGDLDGNGQIDGEDLLIAALHLRAGEPVPHLEALDVVDDGWLDENDLGALVHLAYAQLTSPEELITFDRGDVNDDGLLDAGDERHLDAFLMGQAPLKAHLDAADVNDDGVIDRSDLVALSARIESERLAEERNESPSKDGKSSSDSSGASTGQAASSVPSTSPPSPSSDKTGAGSVTPQPATTGVLNDPTPQIEAPARVVDVLPGIAAFDNAGTDTSAEKSQKRTDTALK